MYSYDRRKIAAQMDVPAKWHDIVTRHAAAEAREMEDLLHEMARYLKSEGLVLDVGRSYLGKEFHGSDGFRREGQLVVSEAKENTIKGSKEQIEKWVRAATELHGSAKKIGDGPALRQVDDEPVGVWQIDISES